MQSLQDYMADNLVTSKSLESTGVMGTLTTIKNSVDSTMTDNQMGVEEMSLIHDWNLTIDSDDLFINLPLSLTLERILDNSTDFSKMDIYSLNPCFDIANENFVQENYSSNIMLRTPKYQKEMSELLGVSLEVSKSYFFEYNSGKGEDNPDYKLRTLVADLLNQILKSEENITKLKLMKFISDENAKAIQSVADNCKLMLKLSKLSI